MPLRLLYWSRWLFIRLWLVVWFLHDLQNIDNGGRSDFSDSDFRMESQRVKTEEVYKTNLRPANEHS